MADTTKRTGNTGNTGNTPNNRIPDDWVMVMLCQVDVSDCQYKNITQENSSSGWNMVDHPDQTGRSTEDANTNTSPEKYRSKDSAEQSQPDWLPDNMGDSGGGVWAEIPLTD
eukprot:GFUD01035915.1.p1 GENE.GFUD01035915.1~~GFUD01035915.1.p1  ORF type:complete len:112 (+),score=40.24 GFUD01035915.1:85-420(+)